MSGFTGMIRFIGAAGIGIYDVLSNKQKQSRTIKIIPSKNNRFTQKLKRMVNKTAKQVIKVPKESIVFYFPTELLDRLEELHFYLQRQIPREKRKRLNRSKLYELILDCVIKDYEKNKGSAILWNGIEDWLKTR